MVRIPGAGVPSGQPTSPWWVVYYQLTHPGPTTDQGFNLFFIVQAPNKSVARANVIRQHGADVTGVAGPFGSKADASKDANKQAQKHSVNPNIPGAVEGWLGSIGGMIASGIEGGLVTLLKDLWDVIVGPLEIIAGFIFAIAVIAIYFKDDVAAAAKMAAMA